MYSIHVAHFLSDSCKYVGSTTKTTHRQEKKYAAYI